MSNDRWSIWIDVEGFSGRYRADQTKALLALGWLMEGIYKIGSTIFSNVPKRLFSHQFGDGFVIISDFPEESAERPIAMAISLMRHLIARGVACKSAISCGGFADVGGCYPKSVIERSTDSHIVPMGEGLMTIIPVMGTALIASHELSSKRKGAVLLIQDSCFQTLPNGAIVRSNSPTTIDWVHSDVELSVRISEDARLAYPDSGDTETWLRTYIDENGQEAGDRWVSSTIESNGL